MSPTSPIQSIECPCPLSVSGLLRLALTLLCLIIMHNHLHQLGEHIVMLVMVRKCIIIILQGLTMIPDCLVEPIKL